MRALTEDEVRDLSNRLNKAAFSLGQLMRQSGKKYSREQTERLRGKREGVQLALGYLKEALDG